LLADENMMRYSCFVHVTWRHKAFLKIQVLIGLYHTKSDRELWNKATFWLVENTEVLVTWRMRSW
jgi:hypothetical protein